MKYEKIVDYVKKALAKKDFSNIEDMALQIDVTGEGEGAFYVAVTDKKVTVEPYEYYDYTAKLTIAADDLIAAVDGKATDVVFQIEGDSEKVSPLLAIVKTAPKAAKKAATPKKAPAKKAEAPKKAAPAKKAEAPKAAPAKKAEAPKKAAPAKKAEAPKAAPAKKAEAPKAAPAKKVEAPKAAPAKKAEAPKKAAPAKKAPAKKTTK